VHEEEADGIVVLREKAGTLVPAEARSVARRLSAFMRRSWRFRLLTVEKAIRR
jgi:hypothetical protein